MLVTSHLPPPADRRDELKGVLTDFHINGELVAVDAAGPVHRYRYALAGATKVSRAIALTPDIVREMGALSGDMRVLDGDRLIEIALVTVPYMPVVEQGAAA